MQAIQKLFYASLISSERQTKKYRGRIGTMIDTQKYKVLLEAERDALTLQLSTLGRVNPENKNDWESMPEDIDVNPSDDSELSDKMEEMEERNAIQNQLENRLLDIERALGKIDAGTYGVCEVSGEAIEEARLDANPAARTSIANKDAVL